MRDIDVLKNVLACASKRKECDPIECNKRFCQYFVEDNDFKESLKVAINVLTRSEDDMK